MVNTCAFIEEARQESIDTILEAGGSEAGRRPARRARLYGPALRDRTGRGAARGRRRRSDSTAIRSWSTGSTTMTGVAADSDSPRPHVAHGHPLSGQASHPGHPVCLREGRRRMRQAVHLLCHPAVPREAAVAGAGQHPRTRSQTWPRPVSARSCWSPRTWPPTAGTSTTPVGIVDLLRWSSDVEGLRRLRLYYLYPREIRPALIDEMAGNPLDRRLLRPLPPARHGAAVAGDEATRERRAAPRAHRVRSATRPRRLRCGRASSSGSPARPTTTSRNSAEFLAEAQLDWAGFFPFSPEEGTAGRRLRGQIADGEKNERLRYLQAIQDDITASPQRRPGRAGRWRSSSIRSRTAVPWGGRTGRPPRSTG